MKVLPSVRGLWFRAVSPLYYEKGLSPKGARLNAGRFNRAGTSAIYLASDEMTALREYRGSGPATPVVLLPVQIEVNRVVDITGDLSGWEDHWQDWKCDWRAELSQAGGENNCSSWLCGDDVLDAKASAILYPSLENPEGKALAFFNEDAVIGTWSLTLQDPSGVIALKNPLNLRK